MPKLLKAGRVVIVLSGRMAGNKGIVVNTSDSGTSSRKFGHCLIAGIAKAPLKTNKNMGKKKISKRNSVKPFVKYMNVNHIIPTRYMVQSEFDCKDLVNDTQMKTKEGRMEAKKQLKSIFKEKLSNPMSKKTGSVSRELLFLKKKLRF